MRSRGKSGFERSHGPAGKTCPTAPKLVIAVFTMFFANLQSGI
jgi:hypothetical protein